jgi:hypothetical protein
MGNTTRRSVLGVLVSLPVVGLLTKVRLFGWRSDTHSATSTISSQQQKYLAVRILRLVNTVERQYFAKHGSYADPSRVFQDRTAHEWMESAKAKKAGLGSDFYSTLQFDADEVSPDWNMKFALKANGSGYLVAIRSMHEEELGAFATDENAVIYEGNTLVASELEPNWMTPGDLVSGDPIDSPSHAAPVGRLAAVLKGFAFTPAVVEAQSGGCQQYPCCSACSCEGAWISGCTNCGCCGCIWCCCPY